MTTVSRLGQYGIGLKKYLGFSPKDPASGVQPIFWRIQNKITDLINTYMTQANGFSLDYGSINEYDHDSRTYPAIFYNFPDEEDVGQDLSVENRLSETTEMEFRVIADTGADLEVISDRIISDFNKFFAEFQHTLKVEGLIDYRYNGAEKNKRSVKAYPVDITMNYELKYRRVMSSIYTVDTSSTADSFSGSAWSPATPVWNTIVSQFETLIATMTISSGFNYDYGSIDEYDPDSRTYPAVFITYPEETGLDEEEEEIYKYNLTHNITFQIMGNTSSDLDKTAFLMRSDFNKLIATNRQTLESIGMDEAEYLGSTKEFRPIKAYPVLINLNYLIHFNRQKKNPYLT